MGAPPRESSSFGGISSTSAGSKNRRKRIRACIYGWRLSIVV